jgi:DNA-binding response OmpR family regulator
MQTTARPQSADILIVEDDPAVAQILAEALEASDYQTRHAPTAAEARRMVAEAPPHLILLDLVLPDADGLVFCADLKTRADVPIIVCSASTEKRDRILALKLGADDFIAKPFDVDELEARVASVLRRTEQRARVPALPAAPGPVSLPARPAHPPQEQIHLGHLMVDHLRRRVMLGALPLHLTPTEYRLLRALASRPNEVLSREELAQQVWGYHEASNGRAVDVHVGRLRAKLAGGPVPAPAIVSVRGFGYKVVWEGAADAAA